MALFHDISEVLLSDTPHNTKKMFPKIAVAVKDCQKPAINMIDPSMIGIIENYDDQKTIEARIVKIADILSVIQYTRQEVSLGNKYMRRILDESISYTQKLYKKVEEYRR
jgi:5'-deoxynucleotidase YfbR-like HD superfamily hydrolase